MSTKTTTIDYGMVMNNQILLAFGNEVCYNTLKRFTGHMLHEQSYLEVQKEFFDNDFVMSAFIDKKCILKKKFNMNHKCDMFDYLEAMKSQESESMMDLKSYKEIKESITYILSYFSYDNEAEEEFCNEHNLSNDDIKGLSLEQIK